MYWKRLMLIAYTFELKFSGTQTLLLSARFMPACLGVTGRERSYSYPLSPAGLLCIDIRDST